MKEIKAYELSDGTIITNEEVAIRMQKDIELKKELTKFSEKNFGFYGEYEVPDFLFQMRLILMQIFDKYK